MSSAALKCLHLLPASLVALTLASMPACAPSVPGAGTGGQAGTATATGGAGSGTGGGTTSGTGGAAPLGGATGSGGAAPDAGATGTGGAACTEIPVPVRTDGATLPVRFALTTGGQPLVFGEPNAISSTTTVIPSNVRFYVSQATLSTASGGTVPVDIVTKSGATAPYGLFFFNAEESDGQTMYLRAPPGSYTGLGFAVGISPVCNVGSPGGRAFPLSEDSQMTWPHGFGYLFLRYEAQVQSAAPNADGGTDDAGMTSRISGAIHMGGDLRDLTKPSAVAVRVTGDIQVVASGTQEKRIDLAMDQVWKGATIEADLSDVPLPLNLFPEMADGERLRRAAPGLQLFVLAP